MLHGYLPLIVLIFFAFSARADEQPDHSLRCVPERDALLNLDYWTFDQDNERGWRAVMNVPGCESAAADLIADYHKQLREKGEPVVVNYEGQNITMSPNGEMTMLYWHEGQVRAFSGETEAAIALFEKSLSPPEQNFMGWNDYVTGSIAFLKKDRAALDEATAKMKRWGRSNLNYRVLDRLQNCFEEPYSKSYSAKDCQSAELLSDAPAK